MVWLKSTVFKLKSNWHTTFATYFIFLIYWICNACNASVIQIIVVNWRVWKLRCTWLVVKKFNQLRTHFSIVHWFIEPFIFHYDINWRSLLRIAVQKLQNKFFKFFRESRWCTSLCPVRFWIITHQIIMIVIFISFLKWEMTSNQDV